MLNNPTMANMKIRYLVVVHIGQPVGVMNPIISLQAFRLIWLMLRNGSREAGLSVSLISGLWWSCSLSVGILLIMERVLDEGQNENGVGMERSEMKGGARKVEYKGGAF